MTFFVCFYLLLGFLIIEIEYYILYSDSDSKRAEAIKNVAELGEKLAKQHKEQLEQVKKSELPTDKKAVEDYEAEKKEFPDFDERMVNSRKKLLAKQDSSNVVNDGSEPTPLTDLDGGD